MEGLIETQPATSKWYSVDQTTALKVGFLVLCFIGVLGTSVFIFAIPAFDRHYYSDMILKMHPLNDAFQDMNNTHATVLIPAGMVGISSLAGSIVCLCGFIGHRESKKLEITKVVIYGLALAAVGLFLGMAITGSMVHNEAWYALKKIEPLKLFDLAEDVETLGFAMAPIAGIGFGALVICTNLVDQLAKCILNNLRRREEAQAEGFTINTKREEVRSCRV